MKEIKSIKLKVKRREGQRVYGADSVNVRGPWIARDSENERPHT